MAKESSWRQNTGDQMGPGVPFQLSSRLIANPLFWVTNEEPDVSLFRTWFLNVASVDAFWSSFTSSKLAGHPHFPYGFEVEPDL